jgi:hypothetical protein
MNNFYILLMFVIWLHGHWAHGTECKRVIIVHKKGNRTIVTGLKDDPKVDNDTLNFDDDLELERLDFVLTTAGPAEEKPLQPGNKPD